MDDGINAGSNELLAASIEQFRNNKNSVVSTMESIRRLVREVELEDEQETKIMLVRELNVEKNVLAIQMELLHCRVVNMMDVGDQTFSEMWKTLEKRLISAASNNDFANENDQSALAHLQLLIKKVLEEFNRLKQETLEYSKELLKDCHLLAKS